MTSTLNLGSKIPMSEVDGLTTAMSNKADITLSNISAGGVNTCFRWLKPDLTRSVSIADGGSMPFDGWLKINAQSWNSPDQISTNILNAYINNFLVLNVASTATWAADSSSIFIPVKTGDVFKWTFTGDTNAARSCKGTLYPYEAAPEEEET